METASCSWGRERRVSFRHLVGGSRQVAGVSRYRLTPTADQAGLLAEHCRHARHAWNLAVEQELHWQPGRRAPHDNEQCAQLTAVRA
ncbi:MAG: helix-turn-helix domain-containing protein [Candidatus Sericytochromatia bacterium]